METKNEIRYKLINDRCFIILETLVKNLDTGKFIVAERTEVDTEQTKQQMVLTLQSQKTIIIEESDLRKSNKLSEIDTALTELNI